MCLFGQFGNFLGEDPPRRAAWTHENETKINHGRNERTGRTEGPYGVALDFSRGTEDAQCFPKGPKGQRDPLAPQGRRRRPWVPWPLGPEALRAGEPERQGTI